MGQPLIKVKATDPTRPYIGFEPNPVCVAYVGELIKCNGFRDCTIVPAGLAAEEGICKLNLYNNDDANDTSASLVPGMRPASRVRAIVWTSVVTFDKAADAFGAARLGVIKIDVEGSELGVVKTLLNVIQRDRPLILMEILPCHKNQERRRKQDELEQLLNSENYVFYKVNKTGEGQYIGLQQLDEIGVVAKWPDCDYAVVPQEKQDKMPV